MVFNAFTKLIDKNAKLVLIFIILIGAFLRLYNFQTMPWSGDEGRDVLVARHMVEYNSPIMISPQASGGQGFLKNSPLYYWIISIFWIITHSAFGVSLCFSIFGILNILFAFYIGKLINNSATGLLSAFLISISSVMVTFSRGIWQPYLLCFFTLTALYYSLLSIKTGTMKPLLLSSFLIIVGLNLHYSFLVFGISLLLYNLFNTKNLSSKFKILFLFYSFVLVCTYLLINPSSFPTKIFSILQLDFFRWLSNLQIQFQILSDNLFSSTNEITRFSLIALITIYPFFLLNNTASYLKGLYALFIINVALQALYSGYFHLHYLTPHYPVLLLVISYLISKTNLTIIKTTLFLVIVFFVSIDNSIIFTNTPVNVYAITNDVAHTILQDSVKNFQDTRFDIEFYDPISNLSDWNVGHIWFALEDNYHSPLVALSNSAQNNIVPLASEPNRSYYVCQNKHPDCLSITKRPYTAIQKIQELSYPGADFTLYRLSY